MQKMQPAENPEGTSLETRLRSLQAKLASIDLSDPKAASLLEKLELAFGLNPGVADLNEANTNTHNAVEEILKVPASYKTTEEIPAYPGEELQRRIWLLRAVPLLRTYFLELQKQLKPALRLLNANIKALKTVEPNETWTAKQKDELAELLRVTTEAQKAYTVLDQKAFAILDADTTIDQIIFTEEELAAVKRTTPRPPQVAPPDQGRYVANDFSRTTILRLFSPIIMSGQYLYEALPKEHQGYQENPTWKNSLQDIFTQMGLSWTHWPLYTQLNYDGSKMDMPYFVGAEDEERKMLIFRVLIPFISSNKQYGYDMKASIHFI